MSATPAEYLRFQQEGGLIDLSARAKYRVTGRDRQRYLNGQLTANVTRLAAAEAKPACITTAKGKLCGEVYVTTGLSAALMLDADAELREPLQARLEQYIIADDVTVEDVTEELALIHVLGGASFPEAAGERRATTRWGRPGEDLWLPLALWQELRAREEVRRHLLSGELAEMLRVEAGLPRWGRELGPDTLPPEAGLDRTHIDYHKGCYIGQETISRLRSVGHVNRELTGFLSPTEAPLLPGMSIHSPSVEGKPVGTLTSAVYSFALAKPIALGYLKRGTPAEGLEARPATAGGAAIPLSLRVLPTS